MYNLGHKYVMKILKKMRVGNMVNHLYCSMVESEIGFDQLCEVWRPRVIRLEYEPQTSA